MAKRKSTKGKQRCTKHTYKTKDRVTRTPLKTGGELMCFTMSMSSSNLGNNYLRLNCNVWEDFMSIYIYLFI
jgi:hypothetical protein